MNQTTFEPLDYPTAAPSDAVRYALRHVRSLHYTKSAAGFSARPWTAIELLLQSVVYQALQDQLGQLLLSASPNMLSDTSLWAKMTSLLFDALAPVFKDLADKATADVYATLDSTSIAVSYSLAKDMVNAQSLRNIGSKIKDINSTTQEAVQQALKDWHAAGVDAGGISGLKDRLHNLKDANGQPLFDQARADRIAQNEATTLYVQATIDALTTNGYAPVVFQPRAHVNCRCYVQGARLESGEKVIIWYTVRDERVCTTPVQTPWAEVLGCRGLHRMILSEGHAGEQWMGNLWNPESNP